MKDLTQEAVDSATKGDLATGHDTLRFVMEEMEGDLRILEDALDDEDHAGFVRRVRDRMEREREEARSHLEP